MKNSRDYQVKFSQRWLSEQKTLFDHAVQVPDGGTIVEIGTAEGGSAFIFHAAVGHRGVKIISFDISPSTEAYKHLKNTSVKIFAKSSLEGARFWAERSSPPIDLLFIDGGHSLQNVYEDFISWVPFLKPGGKIIFHDFDSRERGGLVHLGVHVLLQTLMKKNLLDNCVHQDRLLYGTIFHPDNVKLKVNDCFDVFAELGRKIIGIREKKYNRWAIVGEGKLPKLLLGGLKTEKKPIVISPNQATDSLKHYLVCARPLDGALKTLRKNGVPTDLIVEIDSLSLCYITAYALEKNRDYLLGLTLSRKELFHWEETLSMYEHAFGTSRFPEKILENLAKRDLTVLSKIVSREQIKLIFLTKIVETFIDFKL